MGRRRTRRQLLATLGTAALVGGAGCLDDGSSTPTDASPVDSAYDLSVDHDIERWERYDPDWESPETDPTDADLAVETVIEGLEIPWDIAFAANGEFFLSERIGRISRYEAGTLEEVTRPADVIDHARAAEMDVGYDWWAGGSEGGLLGIAVHPNYPDVPLLYAFYTYETGEEEYRNRLVYYDVTEDDPDETVVIDDIAGNRIIHNGARIAFGPRNYLWVTTGDAGEESLPQRTDRLAGKVLRMEPDGSAPAETPGFDDPRIFSYGHRNPQAISWLPDGTTIVSEHGPAARDEVLLVDAGDNHGWPDVRGPPDDDDYEAYADHEDVAPPLVNTGTETWAPAGGVFYGGEAVPALRNRFLSAGLRSQRLNVVSLFREESPAIGGRVHDGPWTHPDYDAVSHQLFEHELGRLRHVEWAPDGSLYAITSNRDGRSELPEEDSFPREGDDRLVRIVQR